MAALFCEENFKQLENSFDFPDWTNARHLTGVRFLASVCGSCEIKKIICICGIFRQQLWRSSLLKEL